MNALTINLILLAVIALQFLFNMKFLLNQKEDHNPIFYRQDGGCYKIIEEAVNNNTAVKDDDDLLYTYSLDGVAVCSFLGSPTWFQRRYTTMIRNIKANLPPNWAIQIFYTGKGQSLNGININKGLQRMIDNKEVILTLIPDNVWNNKKRHYELWLQRWTWENAKADKVLVFGGNSVLCGNSIYTVNDFLHFDYVGHATNSLKGVGGGSGISLRSRQAMLQVIDYEFSKLRASGPITRKTKEAAMKKWPRDDEFFVSRMIEMNSLSAASAVGSNDKIYNFQIASRNDTHKFGAAENYYSLEVFSASGTVSTYQ